MTSEPASEPTAVPAPTGRRSAALVGAGILLSRLSGLVRERVIAQALGVGPAVDAFRAALRIPNLLQNLLGEGVLSASFIPVYSRLLAEGDEEGAGRVAGAVAGLLALLAAGLALAGVVLARPLALLLAPGFEGDRLELTVTLTRILFPGVGLLVLSAWCLGVLNSHRRFFLAYVAPVLWNGAQVAVVTALIVRDATTASLATGLAWGAVLGSLLQFLVQIPAVRRTGRIVPSLRRDLPGVREVARRFVPVVTGRGVVQLSAWVDLLLASLLAVGAVAALGYASVLYLLPISLFGMSVAAAELPELSRLTPGEAAGGDLARERMDAGLGRIAFFTLPCALLYVIGGDLVVGALFQAGRFGGDDTRLVWYVLAGFSLGLLATTGSRLLQNVLYAAGDARSPARIAAVRVTVAAVLGAVLMFQLDRVVVAGPGVDGIEGLGSLPAALAPLAAEVRGAGGAFRLGALGLALASAVGAWLEWGLLRRKVAERLGPVALGGGHLPALAGAAGLAAVAALVVRPVVDTLHPALGLVPVAGALGLTYLLVATALGVPEAADLRALARRRLGR